MTHLYEIDRFWTGVVVGFYFSGFFLILKASFLYAKEERMSVRIGASLLWPLYLCRKPSQPKTEK